MLKNKINNLLSRSGFKDILVLSSGVLLGQVVSFFMQPIATRLFSVEDFGIFSIIVSTVSIISPIITLQYHMSIVTAESDDEADILCSLNFYLIAIIGTLTTLILVLYNYIYPTTFSEAGLWIYMSIPLSVVTGIIYVVESYNNRYEQYKLMATVALQRSVISNALRVIFGLLNPGEWGLVISQVFSISFGVKKQGKYLIKNYKKIFSSSYEDIKKTAIKHIAQPLFSTPGHFLVNFSYSILPIFINSLYTIEEAGFFSISITVLGLPLNLISSNVARIFFRNASIERDQKGNFSSTLLSTSIILTIISFLGFFILWLISEPLFALIYGTEWSRSGVFVKILIPMYALRFIVLSLMHGFIVANKQNLKLLLQSLFIVAAVVVFILSRRNNFDIETFLLYINWTYTAVYVILFVALIVIGFSQRDIEK